VCDILWTTAVTFGAKAGETAGFLVVRIAEWYFGISSPQLATIVDDYHDSTLDEFS
jgi:hypothetical protein